MSELTLKVDGMSCGHCVRAVDAALRQVPGVQVKRVEVGVAEVSYEEGVTAPEAIAAAVQEQGYPVRGVSEEGM